MRRLSIPNRIRPRRSGSERGALGGRSQALSLALALIVWLAPSVVALRFGQPLLAAALLTPALSALLAGALASRLVRRSLLRGSAAIPVPDGLTRRYREAAGRDDAELVLLDRPEPLAVVLGETAYLSLGLMAVIDEAECAVLLRRLALAREHREAGRRGWARGLEQGPLLLIALLGGKSEQGGAFARIAVPWGPPIARTLHVGDLERRLDDAIAPAFAAFASCLRLVSTQPPSGVAGAALGLGPLAPAEGSGGVGPYEAASLARTARLDALAGNHRHHRGQSAWQRLVEGDAGSEQELLEEGGQERDERGRLMVGAPPVPAPEREAPAAEPGREMEIEIPIEILSADTPPSLWEQPDVAEPETAELDAERETETETESSAPADPEQEPPAASRRRFGRPRATQVAGAQPEAEAPATEGDEGRAVEPAPIAVPDPDDSGADTDGVGPDEHGHAEPAGDVSGDTDAEDSGAGKHRRRRRWRGGATETDDHEVHPDHEEAEDTPDGSLVEASGHPDGDDQALGDDAPAQTAPRRRWWRRSPVVEAPSEPAEDDEEGALGASAREESDEDVPAQPHRPWWRGGARSADELPAESGEDDEQEPLTPEAAPQASEPMRRRRWSRRGAAASPEQDEAGGPEDPFSPFAATGEEEHRDGDEPEGPGELTEVPRREGHRSRRWGRRARSEQDLSPEDEATPEPEALGIPMRDPGLPGGDDEGGEPVPARRRFGRRRRGDDGSPPESPVASSADEDHGQPQASSDPGITAPLSTQSPELPVPGEPERPTQGAIEVMADPGDLDPPPSLAPDSAPGSEPDPEPPTAPHDQPEPAIVEEAAGDEDRTGGDPPAYRRLRDPLGDRLRRRA